MPRCERPDYFIFLIVWILLTGFSFILIACLDSKSRHEPDKNAYPNTVKKLLLPLKNKFAKIWSSELFQVENATTNVFIRSKRSVEEEAVDSHGKKHSLSLYKDDNPSPYQILRRMTLRRFLNNRQNARYLAYYPHASNEEELSDISNKIDPQQKIESKAQVQEMVEDNNDDKIVEKEEDVEDDSQYNRLSERTTEESWSSKNNEEETDDKDGAENNFGPNLSNLTRLRRYEINQHDEYKEENFPNLKFDLSDMIHQHNEPTHQKTQHPDHLCYSALEMILAAAGAVAITAVSVILIMSCFLCLYFRKHKYYQANFNTNSWGEDESETDLNYTRSIKQQPLTWGEQDNPVVFEQTTFAQLENNKPFADLMLDTNKFLKDKFLFPEKKVTESVRNNMNSEVLLRSKTETAITSRDN